MPLLNTETMDKRTKSYNIWSIIMKVVICHFNYKSDVFWLIHLRKCLWKGGGAGKEDPNLFFKGTLWTVAKTLILQWWKYFQHCKIQEAYNALQTARFQIDL